MTAFIKPTNAIHTECVHIEIDKTFDYLDCLIEDFQDALHERFPSVYPCNRLVDHEHISIANNNFVNFCITSYDDYVTIFVTAKPVPQVQIPLRNAWIKQIKKTFAKVVKTTFK